MNVAVSLAARIRAELEGKIIAGDWPPGHRIPFEHELMQRYGCSRMTVSKVLSALAEAGLILRRRRAGSFVAAPRAEQALLEIQDVAAEALRLGLPYRHEMLARDRQAGRLHVVCRHWIGQVPVAHEDRLISLAAVPGAAEESFAALPPGTWLLRSVPWTEAEHVIRARAADAAMGRLLHVPPGAACLVLERRTWHLGAPVTEVAMTYPGDRHALSGRFSPTGRAYQTLGTSA